MSAITQGVVKQRTASVVRSVFILFMDVLPLVATGETAANAVRLMETIGELSETQSQQLLLPDRRRFAPYSGLLYCGWRGLGQVVFEAERAGTLIELVVFQPEAPQQGDE
ncbi:MAG: hypothetical protein Aurels2KO_40600 [Aureliella sp.]